jgi:ribosomal protein S18 acetylase RimI-like enzyme
MLQIIEQEVRAATIRDRDPIADMVARCCELEDKPFRPLPDSVAQIFVATRDEKVVGMLAVHAPDEIRLSHLWVFERYRRCGIATGLIKAAIAYAGRREIVLVVGRENNAAIRCYEACSFQLGDEQSAEQITMWRPA